MCQFEFNPYRQEVLECTSEVRLAFLSDDITRFHQSLPGYAPTPLVPPPSLAQRIGVRQIYVKDESHRFDLSAFKVLGASYATYRFIKNRFAEEWGEELSFADFYSGRVSKRPGDLVLCTATDGNHGRAVAWTARLLGLKAVIFMPAASASSRIESIRGEGAEVVRVDGTYDETVKRAGEEAERQGLQIIADTAYPGYTNIPCWVMAGYLTLLREVDAALAEFGGEGYDVVFIQSGVGSLAAAACWYYRMERKAPTVRLINVEPVSADCLLASVRSPGGQLASTAAATDSIMAGLNCGTPSLVAWPAIRSGVDLFLAVPDHYAVRAMQIYYCPAHREPRIISGESGAAGLAALLALQNEAGLRSAKENIGLNADSRILLLNTEGATDPRSFERIVHAGN